DASTEASAGTCGAAIEAVAGWPKWVFLSPAARGGQLLRWVAQPIRPAQRRNRLGSKGLMGCIAPARHTQPLQLSTVTQPHDARLRKSRPKWPSGQRKSLIPKGLTRCPSSAKPPAQRGRSGGGGQRLAERVPARAAAQRASEPRRQGRGR